MKAKILELLKGMNSDSKKESSICNREICKILNGVCNKLNSIESFICGYNTYPDKIETIDEDNTYKGIDRLPKTIWCNDGDVEFETSWLDIDLKDYFESLKNKEINNKKRIIESVENSLNKHKKDLETLKTLYYENIILN